MIIAIITIVILVCVPVTVMLVRKCKSNQIVNVLYVRCVICVIKTVFLISAQIADPTQRQPPSKVQAGTTHHTNVRL